MDGGRLEAQAAPPGRDVATRHASRGASAPGLAAAGLRAAACVIAAAACRCTRPFQKPVYPFQTAEAALDFVKRRAAKEADLDMVLVEVNFNNMAPGTLANSDLLHHILNELQVPLITMCSYDNEEALSKYMNLGACLHVLKPLDKESFNMLWHQALEHKSKKLTPQGPTLDSTKNGMVSFSTKKSKEMSIIESNNLSDAERNGYEKPKRWKQERFSWSVELHEKFLEAVGALGGNEYATPEGIRLVMNVKGLNKKHISSHLQKHRKHQWNVKQGGQHGENASTRPISELIISPHNKATSESITPGAETDRDVYPLRLWTQVKKRSLHATVLKSGTYTCTSGNYGDHTETVWDKYHNNLQEMFPESNKRWHFMSKRRGYWNNNIVTTDEGIPNEAPKTSSEIHYGASIEISGSSSVASDLAVENNHAEADRGNNTVESINLLEGYGASIESSGLHSLSASDQVGENNHSEVARPNDNVGGINFLEGYGAFIGSSGSGSLLTSDQVRQKGCAEAARDSDYLWSVNLPQGYGAFIEISGSSNLLTGKQVGENNHTKFARDKDNMEDINLLEGYDVSIENSGSSSLLTSDQVRQNNATEVARDNDIMGNINLLEGNVDPAYTASMDFSAAWAHLESDGLDLTGPYDGWQQANSFFMSQLEGSQEHQSLGLEDLLQVGDNACNGALRSLGLINVDEPVPQGSQEQQSLGMDDLLQVGDNACNDALSSVGLINVGDPVAQGLQEHQNLDLEDPMQVDDIAWDDGMISVGLTNLLDEPMAEEAGVEGSEEQQRLVLELEDLLQVDDNAWDNDLRSTGMTYLLDEPTVQEAATVDALVDDPVIPTAQDAGLWTWSPQVAGDYDMLF